MSDDGKKPLGRILVRQQAITESELEEALAAAAPGGQPLATRLTESGALSEVSALKALSEQSGVPGIDLTQVCVRLRDLAVVPREVAVRHRLLPVLVREDRVFVAMANPTDKRVIDELEFVTGKRVIPYIALAGPLMRVVSAAYEMREHGEAFYVGPQCPSEIRQKIGYPVATEPQPPVARVSPVPSAPAANASTNPFAAPKAAPPSPPESPRIGSASPQVVVRESHAPDFATPRGATPQTSSARVPPPLPHDRLASSREAKSDSVAPSADSTRSPESRETPLIVDDAMRAAAHVHEFTVAEFGNVAKEVSIAGRLPKDPGKSAKAKAEGKRTILVVDDEAEIRQLVRRILEDRGHVVFEAARGHEALAALKDQTLDLLVLDAMLPDLHGFEIAKRMKGSERYGHIPIIMISAVFRGWRIAEDLRESYGVHAYIEKPFSIADLVRTVDNALANRPPAGSVEQISADAERLLAQGIEAYQKGNVSQAIEHLREGTRLDPLAYRLHFHLGLLYGKEGRIYDAIQELQLALDINDAHFAALKNLAVLYQKAGFRNKAIEAWEHALRVAPDDATRKSIKEHLVGLL